MGLIRLLRLKLCVDVQKPIVWHFSKGLDWIEGLFIGFSREYKGKEPDLAGGWGGGGEESV